MRPNRRGGIIWCTRLSAPLATTTTVVLRSGDGKSRKGGNDREGLHLADTLLECKIGSTIEREKEVLFKKNGDACPKPEGEKNDIGSLIQQ